MSDVCVLFINRRKGTIETPEMNVTEETYFHRFLNDQHIIWAKAKIGKRLFVIAYDYLYGLDGNLIILDKNRDQVGENLTQEDYAYLLKHITFKGCGKYELRDVEIKKILEDYDNYKFDIEED